MSHDVPQGLVPQELLLEANRDHGTRGRVRPRDASIARRPIVCDGQVVGFYTPHRAATGELRIGPCYITPAYRRRGLMLAVYAGLQGPLLACVEESNVAAVRLHERAGLVRLRRYQNGWYWRRP